MTYLYARLTTLVVAIPTVLKLNRTRSHSTDILMRAMNLYNEQQSLDQFYPHLWHVIDLEDIMAKGKNDWNLVEYRLDDTQIEQFEKWLSETKITPVKALNYCAEKEYKTSFTFSEHNESWCVSITGKPDAKHNSGATLTTWSDDVFEALLMGIFKASVVFEDGKWVTRKSSSRG